MTERLARHAALHPKRMLAIWIAIIAGSVATIALLLPSAITTDATVTNDPESQRGYDAMFSRLPRSDDFVNELVLFRAPGKDVTSDPEVRGEVERLAAALEATGRTYRVTTYYGSKDDGLVSPDKDATVITIGMGNDAEDGIEDVIEVVQQADREPYEVSITGEFTADNDFLGLSSKDLKEGELYFGLPAALIVLLLVFGAVVASLVPILLAIVSIVFALALVAIVGQIWEVSFFVVNMLSAMGLALGVDYALFIVSRFREERSHGMEKLDAIAATGRTASRAVSFSGSAFVIALTGMLLVPDTILRSLAAGAVLVGITAVAAATTLLPAVLSLLGDRVDALRLPFVGRRSTSEGRFWGAVVVTGATAAGGQPRRVDRDPRRARVARARAPHRLGRRPDDSGRLRVEGRLQRARARVRHRHRRLRPDRRRRRHEGDARPRRGRTAPRPRSRAIGPSARRR